MQSITVLLQQPAWITRCGPAISMNKICDQPIQSATEILKHMATHNACALAAGGHLTPELEAFRAPREAWLLN